MLKERLEHVREQSPLIHNITNYVTVNDCANILLACGGSPIMSDDWEEVEEITAICDGLNINLGTLNQNTMSAMLLAGKKANQLSHPVIFDPVGVGASKLRTKAASQLLEEVKFTAIRGNISEIKTLVLGSGTTKGVDADSADAVTEETLAEVIELGKKLSAKTGAIIAITGAIDIIADSKTAYVIRNGHPMMCKITGTGCMLTAMTAAYLAANREQELEAVAAAVCAMGLCGELAFDRLTEREGSGSYRTYIIDEIYHLTGEKLEGGANYEVQ